MSGAKNASNSARSTLVTAGACHLVHDGYTDVLYVLMPVWQIAFDLSLTQTGWLATMYLLAMGGFQLPMGLLAERHGERALLVAGTAVAGAVFVFAGLAGGFITIMTLMFVAGSGSSVQHPLSSSLVARAYPAHARRPALATYNFSGDLGKVIFPFLAASIISVSSWEVATTVLGVIGLVLACVVNNVLCRLALGADATKGVAFSIKDWGIHDRVGFSLLSSIYVIDMIVRHAFLMLLPFCLIGKGMPAAEAGFALSLLFVGGAAGKILVGYLAHWIGALPAVVLSETLTGICILSVLGLPLSAVYWLLPLAGAALNGTSSVLYGSVADFVHEDKRARAFGLFYTVGTTAAAFSPALAGAGGDWVGINTMVVATAIGAFLTLPFAIAMRPALRRAASLAERV